MGPFIHFCWADQFLLVDGPGKIRNRDWAKTAIIVSVKETPTEVPPTSAEFRAKIVIKAEIVNVYAALVVKRDEEFSRVIAVDSKVVKEPSVWIKRLLAKTAPSVKKAYHLI